jgi:hypothetical protein
VQTSPLHPLRLGEFFVHLASKNQMAMSSQRLIKDCNDEGSSDTASDTNDYNTLRFKHGSYLKATYHFIHIGFIILNLCVLITLFMLVLPQDGKRMNQASSPASRVIQYKTTFFDKYGHLSSPFSQGPGPELDKAWHNQLLGMNIRVSQEWLDPFDAKSVRLADGSGVVAQLGFYHELHCLVRITKKRPLNHVVDFDADRRWSSIGYTAHFITEISRMTRPRKLNFTLVRPVPSHTRLRRLIFAFFPIPEHCLEWLRVAVLCRADTTLTTFQWGGHNMSSLETEYPIPRQCADSDRILRWSEEHAVDISKEGLLEMR